MARRLRGDERLVQIRVRMSSVHIPFAPNTGIELAAPQCQAFQVRDAPPRQGFTSQRALSHEHRLCDVGLGQIAAGMRRAHPAEKADRLRAPFQSGRPCFGHVIVLRPRDARQNCWKQHAREEHTADTIS